MPPKQRMLGSTMKRRQLPIDYWLPQFKQLGPHAGYLPDAGASSLALDTTQSFAFTPAPGNADEQLPISQLLFSAPAHHWLGSLAVCFWDGAACFQCGGRFAAHSLIAKTALASCEVRIATEGPSGIGKSIVLAPVVDFRALGTDYFLLPFATEHLDKLVANVWLRLAREVGQASYFSNPVAPCLHSDSRQYEGSYWALHCPHCAALQGENFLKPHGEASGQTAEVGPLRAVPDLLVAPTLGGQPALGGVAVTRLLIRRTAALPQGHGHSTATH